MLKIKACALFAVLFLLLQPLSFCQASNGGTNFGPIEVSADPIVDFHGNLLVFRIVMSKSTGVETEVTLVSPAAKTDVKTYPGILSPIRRGDKAVYALQRVPSAPTPNTPTPATLNLVALVTAPGSLPLNLIDYPLSGKFELFKVAPAFLTGSLDVIYLGQCESAGASILVLTFDGSSFTEVSANPVPLS